MKVIFILSGTSIYGGSTKSFTCLADYLFSKGIEVIVVTPNREGVYRTLTDKGMLVYSLPYFFATKPLTNGFKKLILYYPRLWRKKIYNYYAVRKLTRLCNFLRPDIIHTNSSVIDIGIRVALKINVPHIYHIREYGDLDFSLKFQSLDKFLGCPNSYSVSITKDIAVHKKLLIGKRHIVVYNGIIENSKIRYNPQKSPYFLYAGRIEPTKGLSDLVEAFLKYKERTTKPCKLLIAGDAFAHDKEFVNHIRAMIVQARANTLVEWLGNRSDIDELMYNATATIIPSIYEGFGRVMPEAMANGCVCIARNTGGLKEQLDNGVKITHSEIGFRFMNNDELAKTLLLVQNLPRPKREDIVRNSQLTISSLYTQKMYGESVYRFYLSVLTKLDKVNE